MTNEIDLALLADALRGVEAGPSVEPGTCNKYLLSLTETMRETGKVHMDRIDFTRFAQEDMHALFEWNEEVEGKISSLTQFNGELCKAEPACATTRTFC